MTFKNSIVFGLISIILIVIIDIFLNASEIQTPHFSVIDPVRGKINIPNQRVAFFSEGFYMGSINSLGYWGQVYHRKKNPNSVRIALMGNSFVEGIQVFTKYHFGSILEEEMATNESKKVEVLNFGKGRSNLSDMLYSYNFLVEEFEPDITLFFIDYSSVNVNTSRSAVDLAPYYYLLENRLEIDRNFTNRKEFQLLHASRFLVKNSSLIRLAYNCFKTYQSGQIWINLFDKFAHNQKVKLRQPKVVVFPKISKTANAILFEVIQTQTNIIVFNPRDGTDLPEQIRGMVPKEQLIDLTPKIDSLINNGMDPYFFKGSGEKGHWNRQTHKIVGVYLADHLQQKL